MSVFLDIEKKLGDFSLKVRAEAGDEVLALLGASGCGKSMTLRCVAGIETPDRGRIIVDGITLFDSERHINLTPQQRRTGLMFQNYALFPNMTVYQNIRTGTLRDRTRAGREEKIREIIARFGLSGLENHLPSQLSGGQQQRTALARILISDPRILLLDEPFSALDSHLRFQLEREVREVIRAFGHSVLLVSHDRDEVYRTADRIAVMNAGRVETCGSREEVFRAPGTCTAARLTGVANIAAAEKTGEHEAFIPAWGLRLESALPLGDATHIGFRSSELLPGPGENAFAAEITEVIENPLTCTILLEAKGPAAQAGSTADTDTEYESAQTSAVADTERESAQTSAAADTERESAQTSAAAETISMELPKKEAAVLENTAALTVHLPKGAVLPLRV